MLMIDGNSLKDRVIDLDQVIPCILSHNNHMTENVLQQLLLLAPQSHSSRMKDVTLEIELVVNHEMLEWISIHNDDKSRWHVPTHNDGKKLDDVNFSNSQVWLPIKILNMLLMCVCHP